MDMNFSLATSNKSLLKRCHSMRGRIATVPASKDVCIFCATRMRLAAARTSLRSQRRFLGSTGAVRRSEAAAVVQKEDAYSKSGSQWEPSRPRLSRIGSGTQADPGRVWSPNARDEFGERMGRKPVNRGTNIGNGKTGSEAYDRGLPDLNHTRQAAAEPSKSPSVVDIAKRRTTISDSPAQGTNPVPDRLKSMPRARKKDAGWAKTEAANDLTPEEEAMRIALKHKAAAEEESRLQKSITFLEDEKSRSQGPSIHTARWRPGVPPPETATAEGSASPSRNTASINQTALLPNSKHATRHDATRNATLDDHIAQSRVTNHTSREGNWDCADCGSHNFKQNKVCKECQQRYRPTQQETGAEDETLLAKGWKHVRRAPSAPSPLPELSQQPEAANSSPASGAVDQSRLIEQEKMMRMERTKNGEYVGFGNRSKPYEERVRDPAMTSIRPNWSDSQVLTRIQASMDVSRSQSASNRSTSQPTSFSRPSGNERQTRQDGVSLIMPNGQQRVAGRSRASRSEDGWKRWDGQDHAPYEPSSRSELPDPGLTSDKIVTYSPISTAGGQAPQLFRAMGGQAGDAMQRLRERNMAREPRVARESHVVASPYVSQGNRDRARRSDKQRVSKTDRDEEYGDDEDIMADRRMERKEQRKKAKAAQKATAPPTPIYLPQFISVSNLAGVLKVRVEDFIYKMKDLGFEEMNNDHVLDAETAGLIAAELNFEPLIDREEDRDMHTSPPAEDKSLLPARPPVVTIMGHVDHGKTTLLDYLRKSSVAASEHGGITQHIGAFSVPMPGGRLVTFLDTPGHEAFLSMRQRGANVTDIVILVVAADDSVKPQTIEAIKHAQAAKVPMIVAVNKIDKEDSNVDKVKQDLARYGVEIEDYGGDTQVVCVSGKTGQGMDELEDAAVALADILDMRAEDDGQAEGWVLEATTKKAGRVATILVRRGTLRPGDVIVAGTSWARVRSLRNEAGTMITSAGPGTPVEIDGWREQPAAGDEVIQAPDEQKAKSVVDYRLEASERTRLAVDMEAVNQTRRLEQEKRDQLEKATELAAANPDAPEFPKQDASPAAITGPTFQEVFFVIKGDVSGSVEAVTNSVSALGSSEVRPHILRSGVGPVTEFDVDHAAVAKGHIINFNTTVEGPIQRMAETKDVRILDHSIIYRLTDDVKKTLSERLPSSVTQKVLGEAEIGQVFEINTKGRVTVPIAGCRIRNGVIGRTSKIRVLRGKETIYDGTLSSLKNIKKDVTEMRKGTECGMSFENWTSFQLGDQVQTYEEIIEKRTL